VTIDLEKVRLSQDFATLTQTEKLLVHVPVRKPLKHQFFRVHPGEEYRLECFVVEIDSNETYLVDTALAGAIPGLARPVRLLVYVTRYGAPALWPLKLPGEDGKTNPWNESAAECAEKAMEKWVRMVANRELGAYDVIVAKGNLTDPIWPDKTMTELVSKAFRDRYVDSEDHPLLRELSGIA
jgi:hypothetical protein